MSKQGGKAKPLKKPKAKEAEELDEVDIARIEKQKKDKADLDALRKDAAKKGPLSSKYITDRVRRKATRSK